MRIIPILVFLFLAQLAAAQQMGCGISRARAQLELTNDSAGRSGLRSEDDGSVYVVPVVVHVIHNGGPENVPLEAVLSQIEVLNEDFGRYGEGGNSSPVGADAGIRFCLATVDPQGKPTTGIVRVQSPYTNLNKDNEMLTKNLSRWDQKRYLNIWVVRRIGPNDTEQGFSYYPGDVVNTKYAERDGIVVNYKFFGKKMAFNPSQWNMGRTVTHEAGHYFNLIHTWGEDGQGKGGCGDDDEVFDTPDCEYPYQSQYLPLYDSCRTPFQCGNYRMIENHMDYSEDRCKNIYTQGQAARMREAVRTWRPGLVSYNNAFATGCKATYLDLNPVQEDQLTIFPSPAREKLTLLPLFVSPKKGELTIVDALGRVAHRQTFESMQNDRVSVSLSHFRSGLYIVILQTANDTFSQKILVVRD